MTKKTPVTSFPFQLTVFQPFFVSMQLPYSVVRGELVVVQANVFNYRTSGDLNNYVRSVMRL